MNKWLVLECLIIAGVIVEYFEINQKSNPIHNACVFFQMLHQTYYSTACRNLTAKLSFNFFDVFNIQKKSVKKKLLGTGKYISFRLVSSLADVILWNSFRPRMV